MMTDYAALQVFLPLLGAPLCVLMSRFGRFAWILAMAITACVLGMCFSTFMQVVQSGEEIRYTMGGWAAPFGIEYRIDALAAGMLLLISALAALCMAYTFRSANHELPREQQPYFYSAFLLFIAGLMGIVSTNDAFNMYVFLEISSLSSYVLVALGRNRIALSAAFQYLILGTIGATMLLIGIGLLYLMTGTLNISDLAQRIPEASDMRPIMAALAFITVGICLKIALFPLHQWLPNAYAYAPSGVAAFLAGVSTKVGIYALIRFYYNVFGYHLVFGTPHFSLILAALAFGGILIGSLVALKESNIKRMLAFSSIAQIGYIMLGIALVTPQGLSASITHIVNHAVIKCTLFMAMGCYAYRLGSTIDRVNLAGMGRKMPLTSAGFVVAGLGLMGVPFTAGFISKWTLLSAVIDQGWWVMLGLVAIGSVLAVGYLWRVIEVLSFAKPAETAPSTPASTDPLQDQEAPASMLIPLCIACVVIFWLGLDTRLSSGLGDLIASQLIPSAFLTSGGTL